MDIRYTLLLLVVFLSLGLVIGASSAHEAHKDAILRAESAIQQADWEVKAAKLQMDAVHANANYVWEHCLK